MHAEALRQHEVKDDLATPVLMAVALHVAIVVVLLVAGWWQPMPKMVSVAGPVVEASLVVSQADVRAAEQTALEAPKPAEVEPVEAAPPPQPLPLPAPQPQIAEEQVQPEPQEAQPEPAPVDQEAVARLALEQEQAREREEQEARRRQEQIDLTEREKQAEAERKQRLREQLEEIRKEREAAERRTKMEEQRLQQLADAQAKPAPTPQPAPATPAGGNNGTDTDLAARYALAMHQTANSAWNRALAPERVPCKVRFTQIPGGEVINIQFLSCGFDAQARESVERALRRGPMPYAGFEPVFARQIDLTFCYPEEACPR